MKATNHIDEVFDSEDAPLLVEFSKEDKELLKKKLQDPNFRFFCRYPNGATPKDVQSFLREHNVPEEKQKFIIPKVHVGRYIL